MMRNNLFKQTALIFLSVLVWVCFLIYISINNWCVSFNDFYGFAHSPLKSFYLNSFWPSGYPLFIKFFSLFTEDILFVGKSISLISTLIMLFLILYKIAKLSFSSSRFYAFLFISSNFYIFANWECSDTTATLFFTLGVIYLFESIRSKAYKPIYLACFFFGLSLTFRHQYIAPAIFAIFSCIYCSKDILNLKKIVILIGLFFLGTSIHTIPSLIYSGNLFSTSHVATLYFSIIPDSEKSFGIGMMDILKNDPSILSFFTDFNYLRPFARNYISNIFEFFNSDIAGSLISTFAGIGLFLLIKNRSYAYAIVVISIYFGFLITVSVFKFDLRYYLPLIPISCGLATYTFYQLHKNTELSWKSIRLSDFCILFILLCTVWTKYRPLVYQPKFEWLQTPIEVQLELEQLGFTSHTNALSFSHNLHDTSSPGKERFMIPWLSGNFEGWYSTEEVFDYCSKNKIQYIVFTNQESAVKEVRGLSPRLLNEIIETASIKVITDSYTVLKI